MFAKKNPRLRNPPPPPRKAKEGGEEASDRSRVGSQNVMFIIEAMDVFVARFQVRAREKENKTNQTPKKTQVVISQLAHDLLVPLSISFNPPIRSKSSDSNRPDSDD